MADGGGSGGGGGSGSVGACPRCTGGVLELDPVDALVICTSCGFVADEVALVPPGGGLEGADPALQSAVLGGTYVQGAGHADADEGAAHRLRRLVEQLETMGSVLRLPRTAIQEALSLMHEYRDHVPHIQK
ncbi:hypothetical protein FOA52_003516, partial [Chlamydomonas sp. UWO 241]